MTLKNWKARRAGGRITLNGVDAESGDPVKIVGVELIEPYAGSGVFPAEVRCIATGKDGLKHGLL